MNIFLMIMSRLFSVIIAPFKMFANLVQTDPKKAAIIAAVLGILIGGFLVHRHISQLHEAADKSHRAELTAIAERDQLKKDLDLTVEVNKNNQEIIEKIKADKLLDEQRIAELSASIGNNNKKLDKLIAPIQQSTKADDGPLAKVLVDTLRNLEEQRSQK
jgi:hypothetical protein